jgi:hypothetical protein
MYLCLLKVLLNEFGFSPGFLDPLRFHYLTPIAALLFPKWGGDKLDSHKAFTVLYELGCDLDLSCHFDNAEVTLNVALAEGFTGGDLFFLGMHGDDDNDGDKKEGKGTEEEKEAESQKEGKEDKRDGKEEDADVVDKEGRSLLRVQHRLGWGVLHRGRHMHGAEPLTSGRRCNLILWMRSSKVRNKLCPMCMRAPSLMHVGGLDDGFREEKEGVQWAPAVVDVCHTL